MQLHSRRVRRFAHLAFATFSLLAVHAFSPAIPHANAAASLLPPFPKIFDTQATNNQPLTPPQDALKMLKLPPGFQATLFAAEPDVQNPIAMAFDPRGRLWIAENYTYAESKVGFDRSLRDRIVVFEDTDGDGRFDKRTVFWDGAQILTSLEVGFGGVWALCPPNLFFIPDRDGDDVPDSDPVVVLDGFEGKNIRHNFANGLKWGPDGWLYGRHGITSNSSIGKPGVPESERTKMNCGIWRYHPVRKVFEVTANGTTNPWGMDWNEHGEAFFINTVIGHLWHLIPGAQYRRMFGEPLDPHAYGFLEQHADHFHWDTTEKWSDIRAKGVTSTTSEAGGGHAHSGLMIYQGDNWPDSYRGALLTLNLHGLRANVDRLERSGSGYVGKHAPDFFTTTDPWFRGIDLGYGPDGGVFVLDWSDIGECHENDGVHRTSGRIYKITYGQPAAPKIRDVSKLTDSELVVLLTHKNEWFARQARHQLQQRAAAGRDLSSLAAPLQKLFAEDRDVTHRLRALWALHSIGAANETWLRERLRDADEHIRVAAIRALTDELPMNNRAERGPSAFPDFTRLASNDNSGLVRLALASALQRLPLADRPAPAAALLSHAEDVQDHNLPWVLWNGVKDLAETNPSALVTLAADSKIPLLQRNTARRFAEQIETTSAQINALLNVALKSAAPATASEIISGLAEGLRGRRRAAKPAAWDAITKQFATASDTALTDRIRELSVVFGDGRALEEVRRVALDDSTALTQRRAALLSLIENRPPELRKVCEQLLGSRDLAGVAARGLALSDDPAVGDLLARRYRSVGSAAQPDVIAALVSRPAFAKALLARVGTNANEIPRADLSAFHARQIRSFNDPALTAKLGEVWGQLRDSAADKQQLIAKWKTRLTPATLASGDKGAGRIVFNVACAACHKLYGEGGLIGPDLTGSGRDNLDYLLENIADPSALVPADYLMSVVTMRDGRTFNAILGARTDRTLALQTMTEKITVERADVKDLQESQLSLMPEGLLEGMTETQVRDLLAYLMSKQQVPLPATTASGK